MTQTKLRGIFAAVLTPVDGDGRISIERWAAHSRWLLAHGCHGLGVFGTTGETYGFSVAERQAGLEALIGAGLAPEAMIVGIGACARSDTLAIAHHAIGLGCHRLLMMPPFFYKNLPDEGLYRAFAEVIDGLEDDGLELLAYHFPQASGIPVTMGVIERLVEAYPANFKGLKDSSGSWPHTKELIERFPTLSIFAGADGHLLDVLTAGGAGTISAAANLNSAASREVFDGFERGDRAAAVVGMTRVRNVRKALEGASLIPSLKHVVAKGQNDPEWNRLRPPLVELSEEAGEAVLARLKEAGYRYEA
jgi:4-hydroxy-tetrahydrodipicolinate synthase